MGSQNTVGRDVGAGFPTPWPFVGTKQPWWRKESLGLKGIWRRRPRPFWKLGERRNALRKRERRVKQALAETCCFSETLSSQRARLHFLGQDWLRHREEATHSPACIPLNRCNCSPHAQSGHHLFLQMSLFKHSGAYSFTHCLRPTTVELSTCSRNHVTRKALNSYSQLFTGNLCRPCSRG